MEELNKREAVSGLARIPLLLSLLCRVFEDDGTQFPERSGEIYSRVLRGLLKTWRREKGAEATDVDVELTLGKVSAAAFEVFPASQFGETEFAKHATGDAAELVRTLLRDGILIRAGADQDAPLMFLHRTFHEYLAARHLSGQAWNQKRVEGWCSYFQSSLSPSSFARLRYNIR